MQPKKVKADLVAQVEKKSLFYKIKYQGLNIILKDNLGIMEFKIIIEIGGILNVITINMLISYDTIRCIDL
jgi:hypothetical protein